MAHSPRNSQAATPSRAVTAALLCQLNFFLPVKAALLPGNSWPNSSFELDANSNGAPDFWTKTGSDTAIDVWTTSTSVSATHSLALIDNSASAYGEWLNMAALNGIDRVKQCEVFYPVVNGHGLVFNGVGSQGGQSAWYDA